MTPLIVAQGSDGVEVIILWVGIFLVMGIGAHNRKIARRRLREVTSNPKLVPVDRLPRGEAGQDSDEAMWEEMEPEEDPRPARYREWKS